MLQKVLNRPELFEYLAAASLLVTLVAFSLVRIDATDTPWHLATARYAIEEGHWPVQNTFSYTHPEYPLYQQYPFYQTILYAVYTFGGWEGLSLLLCASWLAIFGLWIVWANARASQPTMMNLAWMLALLGFHQRMMLRPDTLSILLLVILLLLIDQYRRGRLWVAGLFVPLQWCLVNSHQLFPLGLALQGGFVIHLVLVRILEGKHGIAQSDRTLPIWPILLAVAGSTLVCFVSPLGADILRVPAHTAASLHYYSGEVEEFAPFYRLHYQLILVILSTALAAIGLWKKRRKWEPFEVFLWIIGTVVLSAAMRGITLYSLVCVGIFCRSFATRNVPGDDPHDVHANSRKAQSMFRIYCAVVTLLLCTGIIYVRWMEPERGLGRSQPGVGRCLGIWPVEAIKFLKEDPPPGRMINLTWYSGNALIFELFPQHRVFVDPRFESYPRNFLLMAIEAAHKKETLQAAILKYQPDWMVAEMQFSDTRKRAAELIKEGSWVMVHADSVLLILVRDAPQNEDYITRHRLNPEEIRPAIFCGPTPTFSHCSGSDWQIFSGSWACLRRPRTLSRKQDRRRSGTLQSVECWKKWGSTRKYGEEERRG